MSQELTREKLSRMYHEEGMSWQAIAEKYGRSRSYIMARAKEFGIKGRTRSESQSMVLAKEGHPLKGKKHTKKSRRKISEKLGQVWDKMPEEEKRRRSEMTKEQWQKMSPEDRERIQKAGAGAIRLAASVGSKFERFILVELKKLGYTIEFHKTHFLKNQELHIDIFLTDLATAIEIDGPSHFEAIWGQEQFDRIKRADTQKTGLILGEGLCLIRIKQDKKPSQRFMREKLESLTHILDNIKNKFPKKDYRYYEI